MGGCRVPCWRACVRMRVCVCGWVGVGMRVNVCVSVCGPMRDWLCLLYARQGVGVMTA